jgi:uncharacterized protein (TIGR02147 family)
MQTHEVLRKYFEKRKANAGFSLRSLARRLEVSPSFLSRVLSGAKPVPYPLLLKLGTALDIAPEVFTSIKEAHSQAPEPELAPKKGKRKIKTALEDWDLASVDSVSILRQWYYLPILEFTTLGNYDGAAESIASRLGLSLGVVESALRELEHLGLLEWKKDRFVKTKEKLRWGSGKSVDEVRKFHDQMLARAQLELRRNGNPEDFALRFITGITLSTTPDRIAAAKKKLAECLHDIANELITDSGTEVYHLAAQLIPLTKK